jgi:ribonucleoside-triphosphate reductase
MRIIKRSGEEQEFNPQKISVAIGKANDSVPKAKQFPKNYIPAYTAQTVAACENLGHTPTVQEVQDIVEDVLMDSGHHEVARSYIKYRYTHDAMRQHNTTDDKILALIEYRNEEVKQENSNKNPQVVSVQRDYMAGEVSKDLTMRMLLPKDIVEAHNAGIIHFHDADYYAQHMHNCDLLNLDDMLQNGTVISGTLIERPHRFSTACNIATQIIAQVASCQYGGQSISLTHLAKFVDVSRKAICKEVDKENAELHLNLTEYQRNQIVDGRLRKEVRAGIQTIQYQVITLMTTNGQAPFITVFMYLNEAGKDEVLKHDLAMCIEEMLRQRYEGVKNEVGVYITPAFPKLIYVLEDDNIQEGQPFFYLTKMAAKCTARRMVPDYISEKKMREYKLSKGETEGNGDVYTCMGCRSFLTPDRSGNGWDNIANAKNYDGKPKYYGRFNQGVVTINLVDVALSANKDEEAFWRIFDERLELCHRALQCRHKRLKGTLSDVAPILWQYGALARLKKGETIDKLLYNGYSTISLGYAGLYECCMAMYGKSHTDPAVKPFALKVMQHMNDKCNEWKAAENIDYSLYGTPLESTTYKFAKCLQKRFGIIKDVTDHEYITNSYHVNVREKIDAFSKLAFESEFQKLSPGGAISYIEVPNMQDNLEAVIAVMQFIYDHIMYAELNTKSDYCQVCGYDGEIQIVKDNGKLVWECPHCHNRDQHKMNVARRTCGYIGTQYWNQGRTQEIAERVTHL